MLHLSQFVSFCIHLADSSAVILDIVNFLLNDFNQDHAHWSYHFASAAISLKACQYNLKSRLIAVI